MMRVVAEPPIRRLDLVVQTSSSLLNASKNSVEMNDTSTVNEVGKLLQERNVLPYDDYIFIQKQRLIRDQCSLRWHGVQNGDYLYIFKGTVNHVKRFANKNCNPTVVLNNLKKKKHKEPEVDKDLVDSPKVK
ncbi:Ubiquitin-like protein [Forsythia ovata]|uniref:Ubiquitin-like protein n=1 Tax=Forsythia ovata TaxID=205694 RepID=A0ABD1S0U3_9LAMI